MSDYHPDGAQLFWPSQPIPFMTCLGLNTFGDDIAPEHMRAFAVPAGVMRRDGRNCGATEIMTPWGDAVAE